MPATLRLLGLSTMLILGAVGCALEPPTAMPPPMGPEAPGLTSQAPTTGTDPAPEAVAPTVSGQAGPRVDVPWTGNHANPVVIIQNNRYQPYYTHVRMGGSVTWINRDLTTHSVTSPVPRAKTREGEWGAVLAPGESYTRTFSRYTGTFTYHSTFDKGLTGNIIVIGDRRQDLFWSDHFSL